MPAKGPTEEVALRQAINRSREITNAVWYKAVAYYLACGRYTNALRVVENLRTYLRHEGKTESPEFVALTTNLGVVLSTGLGQLEETAKAYQEADELCIRLHGRDSIERGRYSEPPMSIARAAEALPRRPPRSGVSPSG
ncbi:MAG: hypothetical protein IPN11_10945 [Opitutaceae bacterium]|nr:hypothetical protein [Opitutaceae bacterium]